LSAFGDDLHDHLVRLRLFAPVIRVGRKFDGAAAGPGSELHRAGADRLQRDIRAAFDEGLRHDAEVQITQQGRIGRRQRELDRLGIDGFHRRDRRIKRALRRVEILVEDRGEGEHHVSRGERAAIGKFKVRPQLEDPGGRVRIFPAFGEVRLGFQAWRQMDETGVDQVGNTIGGRIAGKPRVKRTCIDIRADGDARRLS